MHASDYWPTPTAHQTNWEQNHNPYVYQYDSADDGPEWYTLRVILASHWPGELRSERHDTRLRRQLRITVAVTRALVAS